MMMTIAELEKKLAALRKAENEYYAFHVHDQVNRAICAEPDCGNTRCLGCEKPCDCKAGCRECGAPAGLIHAMYCKA